MKFCTGDYTLIIYKRVDIKKNGSHFEQFIVYISLLFSVLFNL